MTTDQTLPTDVDYTTKSTENNYQIDFGLRSFYPNVISWGKNEHLQAMFDRQFGFFNHS